MNVDTIRQAFKTSLAALPLRVHPYVPAKPEPPCLVVVPDETFISYNDAMAGGLTTLHFKLVLLVQWGDDRAAQKALDEFLSAGTGSTNSIIDTLHGNGRNLGGAVNDVIVDSVTDYGTEVKIADMAFGQAVLNTRAHTPRT